MLPKYTNLTREEKEIILNKGTERAFSGQYFDHKEPCHLYHSHVLLIKN